MEKPLKGWPPAPEKTRRTPGKTALVSGDDRKRD
jgi:hypothetical protein